MKKYKKIQFMPYELSEKMTCKDCIHYEVCVARVAVGSDKICSYFKDKSHIIESPCGIGDSIFYIHRGSQGNNYILKADVLGVIVSIYEEFKRIYLRIIFEDSRGYTDITTATYGVNAFSSYEEAELKLKELRK